MKKLISLFLIVCNLAQAECDFSKDIQLQQNGTYTYSKECHIEVGKIIQQNEDRKLQVEKLTKSVELSNLAIDYSEKRLNNCWDTNGRIEDRVNAVEKMNDTNKILFFAAGVIFTGLAVWGAGQLR